MIHTMRRLRKGAHLERPRRRWIAWTVGVAVLVLATVAVAALISREDSAPDNFSARSIGNVDIGNAVDNGIFHQVDLTDLEPGDTFTACVGAVLDNPIEGEDDPRFWVVDGSGDLADDLNIEVNFAINTSTTIGNTECMSSGNYEPEVTGTMSGLASAHDSYENGIPWRYEESLEIRVVVALDPGADASAIAGDEATLAVAFENRPTE